MVDLETSSKDETMRHEPAFISYALAVRIRRPNKSRESPCQLSQPSPLISLGQICHRFDDPPKEGTHGT